MYRKETEVGLSRMIAGYACPWISKKDQTKKDIEIQEIKRKWNHCTEGWVHTPEAIDEVKGTFLYVCDDDLREYLSQYIEVEN